MSRTPRLRASDAIALAETTAEPEAAGVAASLITSTRNRAQHLAPFLESLERIETRHSWEVILVDNGSTDDTWTILQAFATRSRLDVRILREPAPGASQGRNAAIRAARGRLLAFTDDDCYPRPDFIDAVAGVFDSHEVGFIGGQVLLFDPEDDPICVTQHTGRLDFPPSSIALGEVQGACMAFRREVFRDVGLFDPAFGAGAPLKGAEDCDMVTRASFAGWSGGFFPDPVVYHHHRRRGRASERVMSSYDYSRGALFAKLLLRRPAGRLAILKQWYWATPLFDRWSRRTRRKLWRELRGACRYLLGFAWSDAPRLG